MLEGEEPLISNQENESGVMRRQTTSLSHHLLTDAVPKRLSNRQWLGIFAIGLLLGLAIIARTSNINRKTAGVQDYVRIVTVSPRRQEGATVYNYAAATKASNSASTGQPFAPAIDDASSEEAYMQSCLAALTREKAPEIMALSETEREEMCTDPRRH